MHHDIVKPGKHPLFPIQGLKAFHNTPSRRGPEAYTESIIASAKNFTEKVLNFLFLCAIRDFAYVEP